MSKGIQRLLALESATDWLSVAVLEGGGRVVALEEHAGSRQHSTALLSVVDAALRAAGAELAAIDAMAITTGPGSFTSLRIGLATLKGLAFGRSIPVVGVSTLEVMALAARTSLAGDTQSGGGASEGAGEVGRASGADGPEVLALLDARRGEWYAGAWRAAEAAGGLPVETLAAGLYAPARLAEDLPRPVVAVCPEPGPWREAFERAGLRVVGVIEGPAARPRADSVGRLGLLRLERGEGESASTLSARYLRRAQAEAQRTGRAVEAGETERLERVDGAGGSDGGGGPSALAAPENVA